MKGELLMQRDIKFRGKPVKPYAKSVMSDGSLYIDFEYGGFYRDFCYGGCPEGKDYIISFNSTGLGFNEHILVEKGSVGQFTGLKDENGNGIYEGDIIQFYWESDSCWGKEGTYKGYVTFNEGVFEVNYIGRDKITTEPDGYWHENSQSDDIKSLTHWSEDIKIIGNVYDNPELIRKDGDE